MAPSPFPSATAFPWKSLPRISRSAIPALNETISLLGSMLQPGAERVAEANDYLSDLFKTEAELSVRGNIHSRTPNPNHLPHGASALLQPHPGQSLSGSVLVVLEAPLAHRFVTTILATPYLWPNPSRPAPPPIHDACAALILATARHLGFVPAFQLETTGTRAWMRFHERTQLRGGVIAAVDGTLRLGRSRFAWTAYTHLQSRPTSQAATFDENTLRTLGAVPLSVPIVGAVTRTARALLETLHPGAAWLPGPSWTITLSGNPPVVTGPARLWPPASDSSLPCFLSPDGTVMVGNGDTNMQDSRQSPSSPQSPVSTSPESATSSSSDNPNFPSMLADAPVLVRVELGTVSLTAQQWADVRPGMVLTTGHPVGQQVILRVGDLEVARGELVNVEGELGVRIQSLSNTPAPTTRKVTP